MINKTTEDLIFISYQDCYAKEYHDNFLSQSETAKYMLWKPTNNEIEARDKLTFWSSNLGKNDIFCLIQERKTKKMIGFVCVYEIEKNIYGEIGIAIGLDFVGKGYGKQTLKTLVEATKERGGKELHYSHFEENEPSKALALKQGFVFYKRGQRTRKYDNKTFNELFYKLKLD